MPKINNKCSTLSVEAMQALQSCKSLSDSMYLKNEYTVQSWAEFTNQENDQKCPKCKAKEAESMTPRTVYECGSSDYDQRTGTFKQSIKCKTIQENCT
jgi:hypothetical protein